MPVPDFVLALREHIGHAPLPLVGVTGVVRDDAGRVLCTQRADTGQWSLVSGILEPGEDPVGALAREVLEETALTVEVGDLTSVLAMPPITYPNGDVAQYLDLCFHCRWTGGEPVVNDDESLAVGWFSLAALPELAPTARERLGLALAFTGRPHLGRLPLGGPSRSG